METCLHLVCGFGAIDSPTRGALGKGLASAMHETRGVPIDLHMFFGRLVTLLLGPAHPHPLTFFTVMRKRIFKFCASHDLEAC